MQALFTALSSLWLSLGQYVLTSSTGPTQPMMTEIESKFKTISFTEVQTWTGPWEVTCSYLLVPRQNCIYPHPCQASAYLICSPESPAAGIPHSLCSSGWQFVQLEMFSCLKIQINIRYFSWMKKKLLFFVVYLPLPLVCHQVTVASCALSWFSDLSPITLLEFATFTILFDWVTSADCNSLLPAWEMQRYPQLWREFLGVNSAHKLSHSQL